MRFTRSLFNYIAQALGGKRWIYRRLVVASPLHPVIGRCFGRRVELYIGLAGNGALFTAPADSVYDRRKTGEE